MPQNLTVASCEQLPETQIGWWMTVWTSDLQSMPVDSSLRGNVLKLLMNTCKGFDQSSAE